jgi:hypothetical protein
MDAGISLERLTIPTRMRLESPEQIRAVEALHDSAVALRNQVSRGEYDEREAAEFWRLTRTASLTLFMSNTQLSERAGLGTRFFSTSPGRYPKFPNMLRALNAIIDASDQVLADALGGGNRGGRGGWIANPLAGREADASELEDLILRLVRQLRQSNSLSGEAGLDAVWRRSLIEHLETLLALLRAPLLDRSLVNRTKGLLVHGAAHLGDHALGGTIGFLIGWLGEKLV